MSNRAVIISSDYQYNKFIKEYGSRPEWDNEKNPEFIPEQSEDKDWRRKNSSNLYMISQIEYILGLQWKIWPDGIDTNEILKDSYLCTMQGRWYYECVSQKFI